MKANKLKIKRGDKPRAIAWLSSQIDNFGADDKIVVEIKKNPQKRSLTANGYAWVLIDKLADEYGVPPELVYKDQLNNIGGHSVVILVDNDATEKTIKLWEDRGLGWTSDIIGEYATQTEMRLSYGSSAFDTRQMAMLIDAIVQECKAVGIETMPPQELEQLVSRWECENNA